MQYFLTKILIFLEIAVFRSNSLILPAQIPCYLFLYLSVIKLYYRLAAFVVKVAIVYKPVPKIVSNPVRYELGRVVPVAGTATIYRKRARSSVSLMAVRKLVTDKQPVSANLYFKVRF